jgi:hypothetical protein
MKKLILAAVVSAFAFTSFHASACDRDEVQNKGTENPQAKKDGKKSNDAAKPDQKKS